MIKSIKEIKSIVKDGDTNYVIQNMAGTNQKIKDFIKLSLQEVKKIVTSMTNKNNSVEKISRRALLFKIIGDYFLHAINSNFQMEVFPAS